MSSGFRNATSGNNASAASQVLNLPAGRVAGVGIFAVVTVHAATTIALTANQTDWLQIGTTQLWAGGTRSSAVFYKVSSGTEAAPTASFGATAACGFVTTLYEFADQADIIEDFAYSNDANQTSATIPVPTVGATTRRTRLLVFAHSTNGAISPPSPLLERTEVATNTSIEVCDFSPYDIGSTPGGQSLSTSSGQHAAWAIAIAEDAAVDVPVMESNIASNSPAGGATTLTPSYPAIALTEELMLFTVACRSATAALLSQTGNWTPVRVSTYGNTTCWTYAKIYDGTAHGTWTFNETVYARGLTTRFSSPHPSQPVGDSEVNGSASAVTGVSFPAIGSGNGGLGFLVGYDTLGSASSNSVSGWASDINERVDSSGNFAAPASTVHLFHAWTQPIPAGGSGGPYTANLATAAEYVAHSLLLMPTHGDITAPAAPTGLSAIAQSD